MGFRFQKRINILPGVRANLSKSGVSASLGPRGADVNIGRNGVTANAGIPGTGLSYRSKVGGRGGVLGILAVIAGLGFWVFQHRDRVEKILAPHPAMQNQTVPEQNPAATSASSVRFVHRDGSLLRETRSPSGKILKRETKGAQVILLARDGDWVQVRDADLTGWMRGSVLGASPPD
jgi:hypothetical protein